MSGRRLTVRKTEDLHARAVTLANEIEQAVFKLDLYDNPQAAAACVRRALTKCERLRVLLLAAALTPPSRPTRDGAR